MLIYIALLIPIVVAFILYKFFRHETTVWEFFIPFGVSLLFILISKASIEYVQVSSDEYWGSFVKEARYYEPWNEWITKTCQEKCCCDSKGENCSTTTVDCSYERYHGPEWEVETNNGEEFSVSENEYKRIKAKLGNETFKDLGRHYYTEDGDEYYSQWKQDSASSISITTVHTYENRVKAADQSVFHFRPVNDKRKEQYNLKDYPAIVNNKQQAIMGDSSEDAVLADKKIRYANALLGKAKQVKIFMIVFKNQPLDAAIYQESYWQGGNKNEFTVCVGIDNDRNVKWAYVISWTKVEILKVRVRDHIQAQTKLSLQEAADYIRYQVEKDFVRKQFKEFSYLTVDPPTWAVILCFCLTAGINLLLSIWIIKNEYEQ